MIIVKSVEIPEEIKEALITFEDDEGQDSLATV
jgi:hypothetical protein